jgi:hypothetical protein
LTLFAPSLALASGLAVPGVISPATSKEPELTAEMSSLAARAFPAAFGGASHQPPMLSTMLAVDLHGRPGFGE